MNSIPLALCLALSAVSMVPVVASAQSRPSADPAVKTQLESLGYTYELDDDNDYKLVFEVGEDGKRSQLAYVRSAVESYGEHEIREIWSPGYIADGDIFPVAIANRLLDASNLAKMGAWVKQGREAVFVVKIRADASQQELADAIDIAIRLADEMENELTPGKDDL